MIISYEEAVAAQQELENKILQDPNVVSIGVIEETNDLGDRTGGYAISVGVISSEAYQASVARGDSVIPREYDLSSNIPGREPKLVHIHVSKTGEVHALHDKTTKQRELPSAIDDIPEVDPLALSDQSARRRPTPGGYSIGHPSVTAGTLSLLVEYEHGPYAGKAFILSNNHVIAHNNAAYVGDPVIQPGRHDSGVVEKDIIAHLHRWVPLSTSGNNLVDAAIAEVRGGKDWSKFVMPYVSKIGFPGELTAAALGMHVEKTGRTTGYTTGTITSLNQTVKVQYSTMGTLIFRDQIRTTHMSQGGDSGSCLFEAETRKPVGLLFAGDDTQSFHNPKGAPSS